MPRESGGTAHSPFLGRSQKLSASHSLGGMKPDKEGISHSPWGMRHSLLSGSHSPRSSRSDQRGMPRQSGGMSHSPSIGRSQKLSASHSLGGMEPGKEGMSHSPRPPARRKLPPAIPCSSQAVPSLNPHAPKNLQLTLPGERSPCAVYSSQQLLHYRGHSLDVNAIIRPGTQIVS